MSVDRKLIAEWVSDSVIDIYHFIVTLGSQLDIARVFFTLLSIWTKLQSYWESETVSIPFGNPVGTDLSTSD